MKILITAATDLELQLIGKQKNVTIAKTGVGIASTIYQLPKLLNNSYDLVLNIGIAGSFSDKFKLGDVVNVGTETFGDFGVITKEGFYTCFEEKIIPADLFPFVNGTLISDTAKNITEILGITTVNGITNNTVSGEANRIKTIKNKFAPDIETMEGAAFFYVCLCENIPFAEIRSISNMVEPRDKSKWNIPLALNNLSDKVNFYIKTLLQSN